MARVIGKISVYKHSFCYLNINVQQVKQKNALFHQPIVLWCMVGTLITIGDLTDIFAIV